MPHFSGDVRPSSPFTNDHDPKPLYFQTVAGNKDPFIWEYMQAGPEVREVRVAKTKV